MKNYILFILAMLFFISCNTKEDKSAKKSCISERKKTKKFTMYQMSEMAVLMEQMFIDNQRLKQRIINGDSIGEFPAYFLKIHTAVMTDSTENDTFFKEQAVLYIKSQQLIYNPETSKQNKIKLTYNEGVTACIRCHEGKCGGPIPKIKKLYIQ